VAFGSPIGGELVGVARCLEAIHQGFHIALAVQSFLDPRGICASQV
jgi:hypothetical protein